MFKKYWRWMPLTVVAIVIASSALCYIPEELKTVANKLSFLAALASRCETSLAVKGKAGLRSEACVDFEQKVLPVLEEFRDSKALWLKAAQEVDQSISVETKLRWKFLMDQIEADRDTVFKTLDHIRFLRPRNQ